MDDNFIYESHIAYKGQVVNFILSIGSKILSHLLIFMSSRGYHRLNFWFPDTIRFNFWLDRKEYNQVDLIFGFLTRSGGRRRK